MPVEDTAIGGANDRFPHTRHSAIEAIRSGNAAERRLAGEIVVAAYWKPVYKYIRLKYRRSNEDAKDLTQGFFARSLEKDFFAGYDASKAAFRTFLRVCLDGYLANESKSEQRLKRGGGVAPLSLDFESAEGELSRIEIPTDDSLDEFFHSEWRRSVFATAVGKLEDRLKSEGKQTHWDLFRQYDLADEQRPTYAELALSHKISATDVTNYLAAVRRDLRRLVLETLRELTATDREFESEARFLLR